MLDRMRRSRILARVLACALATSVATAPLGVSAAPPETSDDAAAAKVEAEPEPAKPPPPGELKMDDIMKELEAD